MRCPKAEPVEGSLALVWVCTRDAGHAGPCAAVVAERELAKLDQGAALRAAWEARTHCGEGFTGDPFCDVECQRERGHEGAHRFEWGSS